MVLTSGIKSYIPELHFRYLEFRLEAMESSGLVCSISLGVS